MYIGPEPARAAAPATDAPQVVVMGLGYIGLPTAAVIARAGTRVLGVDVADHVVATINEGRIHIEEVDLDGLVRGVVERGLLSAATAPAPADTFLIAVPTPFDGDRQPDVSYVLSAARAIAPVVKPGDLVILESTSPVGTTERVAALLAELRPDLSVPGHGAGEPDIAVAYCPERVLPGRIVQELIENDRVIGGVTPACSERALAFYRGFVRGTCIAATAREAEMVKLVENSYRDVNIAFANEISVIADGMGIDVRAVIALANRHPRVEILSPGPGVGGHCIAVDPWFLVAGDPANSRLIRTAREVNDAKTDYVVARAAEMIEAAGEGARIACLGLAFKANIDDFRASPALAAALALAKRFGERVRVVEPYTPQLPLAFEGTGAALVELDEALATCTHAVVLVDHAQFRAVPLAQRRHWQVYDTRGLWPDQPR